MLGHVTTTDSRPLEGVAVTNGRDVVRTDEHGRFELPVVTSFISITRPAGYDTDRWWVRVDPGAERDEPLRFELREHPQQLPFEFVHLTDTHMTHPDRSVYGDDAGFGLYREGSLPHELVDFLRRLPERAPGAQAVFITGDLVDHGLDAEFRAYTEALSASPVPVHVIPGNHDHMNGTHGFRISRNNYLTNEGDPALYEAHLGPRWYSFDIPGCHVVAMDWHSHELGLDHELQNAWVRNDLAQLPEGAPWILLFHDQPNDSLTAHLPWQPVAAFSGHWHTSRVVEVDGTLHVNSPTSFFASLDYSPPAYRRVTWDGERVSMRTETLPAARPAALADVTRATFSTTAAPREERALWRTRTGGAGHRQRIAVDRDRVFAGTQVEDEPRGWVEALELGSGALVWRTPLGSAVKSTPAIAGDRVIVGEVSGDVHALDRESGEVLWTLPSSDPLRRFAWGSPTVADGLAFLGDPSDLRAIDVRTGEVRWRRTDLSPHHNLVNHGAPLVIGDLLVMGFWPTPQYPVGLDARTGETVWATASVDQGASFFDLKALLITGTAVHDPREDAVLLPGFGGTACVDRTTGTARWATSHPGGFSPASPVVTPRGYVVTVAGHGLRMLDPATGATIWDLPIDGDAPFPMASYTKRAHPVFAPPVLHGDVLLLAGLDGTVRTIGLDGAETGRVQLASPLAGGLVVAGDAASGRDVVLALGTDGNVVALAAETLVDTASARAEVGA
ncbi:outer membrane protein assembly factor BamB family protein [Microbacterium album]|uniref:Calcineurin-like phosphoesterase domain-containing protein n=1 Tax=Microbacterium album TaxID=2053191 RepID=A0A917IFV2_9MICO|nr:PQQ-binding-like beta-propeller repeat protein [Microbacterium album]GGH45646.1 hypothetical protein GCM10010921_21190 [Microbacterium album]